jgi:hypothetical protein
MKLIKIGRAILIVTFFKWIGNGFCKFFGLFWEYFKANKNDYCPAINWEDDEK